MSEIPRSEQPEGSEHELEVARLCDEIEKAIENAPPEEGFLERREKSTKVARKIILGKKLSEEEKKPEIMHGEVEFPNFDIFVDALYEFGFDKDFIESGAGKHERAHFNAATEEGLKPKILLRFYKLKDGSVEAIPSISIRFKEDKEGVADSLIKTIKAPTDLSPSDREKIE